MSRIYIATLLSLNLKNTCIVFTHAILLFFFSLLKVHFSKYGGGEISIYFFVLLYLHITIIPPVVYLHLLLNIWVPILPIPITSQPAFKKIIGLKAITDHILQLYIGRPTRQVSCYSSHSLTNKGFVKDPTSRKELREALEFGIKITVKCVFQVS